MFKLVENEQLLVIYSAFIFYSQQIVEMPLSFLPHLDFGWKTLDGGTQSSIKGYDWKVYYDTH